MQNAEYRKLKLTNMQTKSGFTLRPLGQEYILVGESVERVNFNKMIVMNETAAFLWKKVGTTHWEAKDLAKLLLAEYEVDEDTAMKDAQTIVESWKQAGIIE